MLNENEQVNNPKFDEMMGTTSQYPEDTLFYHYCSPETFLAICTGKKLRFSDLNSMNDSLEGHWGYNVWIKVANELIAEKLIPRDFIDELDEIIHKASFQYLRLASCLSKDGDVLSQWRAYGNDGNGYCIGFSANELTKMPIRILNVIYDEEEQKNIIRDFVKTIYSVEKETNREYADEFLDTCLTFAINLSRFKNPAFSEELEVRLIHILTLDLNSEYPKYEFSGGIENGQDCSNDKYKVNYRMNGSVPTAYLDIDFFYENNPIKKVILGPKNNAHSIGVYLALNSFGLNGVEVIRSKASYR